jgi:AcrR family transcriptional regulator
MPRNRMQTPRDHRVTEIVMAAKELFLSRGFVKTPMSHIASEVGIANAAVYWYFPTKDHLLAEVFTRALDEEMERLAAGPDDPFEGLIQGLLDLRAYRQLHMTIHDRMSGSEVVLAAHDRLIEWIRETVADGLAHHGYDTAEDSDLIDLIVVLFEGTNVPGVQTRTATDMIKSLLVRLGVTAPP